jgi:hypothetical protein
MVMDMRGRAYGLLDDCNQRSCLSRLLGPHHQFSTGSADTVQSVSVNEAFLDGAEHNQPRRQWHVFD